MSGTERGPEPAPSLSRRTANGVIWLTLQSLATRGTGLVSQIVLAWLLLPADFGLIGLASTISFVVNVLVTFGLDDVLLQRRPTMQSLRSTAVWFSATLGLLGMAVLLALAPVAQAVYGVPGLALLMVPLAVSLPLGAMATVPFVVMRSRLEFRFLAGWGAVELMLTQALTIALAALGYGAFSFALPVAIVAVVRLVVFWRKAPVAISRRWRLSQLRYLTSKGVLVFGTRVINELVWQGDYMMLGLLATPATVGLYYFAFRLAAQPVRMLAGNFQNVVFPALMTMRGDPARQVAAGIDAAVILSYLVMPACFLQAAVAGPVVRLLFAAKWAGAIPMVQALSVGLPFDAVCWIAGSMLVVRGEFRRSLLYSAVPMPVFFAAAATGAWLGAGVGTAVAVSLFYIVTPTIYTLRVFRSAGATAAAVRRIYLAPIALSAVATGIGLSAAQAGHVQDVPLLELIVTAGVGGAAYVLCVHLYDRSLLRHIAGRLGLERLLPRLMAVAS